MERAMSVMNLGSSAVGDRRSRWGEQFKTLVVRWRQRFRSRYELMNLNEADLRDIGMTRGEAELESSKPFWLP
jgi:uncharacterized protein YjiS (DUF1127 family)